MEGRREGESKLTPAGVYGRDQGPTWVEGGERVPSSDGNHVGERDTRPES